MSTPAQILTPIARLLWGSLYTPRTTDYDGNPLTIKNGSNAGQPTQRFEFGVGIPKTAGLTHWSQEPWGKIIWEKGHASFPNGSAQRPDFAWKVTDGDSTVPNKRGTKPCDKEGNPGHWVLSFSSSFAPRIYNANGTAPILEPNAVKPGYYVQVAGTVDGNTGASPGIYLNHNMVALAGYGPEIVSGPDPTAVGFGAGVALPPGASAVPVASFTPPAAPAAPAAPPVAYVPPPAAPAAPAPPATVVQPAPAFLAPPVAPAPPPPPPAPPAPPAAPVGPQMTAKAAGQPYAQFIASGWTEAQLRQHGYIV